MSARFCDDNVSDPSENSQQGLKVPRVGSRRKSRTATLKTKDRTILKPTTKGGREHTYYIPDGMENG